MSVVMIEQVPIKSAFHLVLHHERDREAFLAAISDRACVRAAAGSLDIHFSSALHIQTNLSSV